MERVITYPFQIPLETDVMNANKNAMVGLSKLAVAILGAGISVSGLACTAGTGLNVSVDAGEIYTNAATDSTSYSSLGTDSHQILKQGISLDPVSLACPAPTTLGQSINYLIQAKCQDVDTNPLVPLFYNSANPTVPFTGMGGNGLSQYLTRSGKCVIQVKAGIAASTGTQTTPSADAGFTGLWVVAVDYGDTSITNPIVKAANAPFINSSLLGNAPAFSVSPTMPTTDYADNSTKGATTAFVKYLIAQVVALIPSLVGYATQAWVNAQGFLTSVPVTSVAGRTGAITLAVSDVSGAAPLASPSFSGNPIAPTQSPGDNSTKLATTAFVQAAVGDATGYPKIIASGDSNGNQSAGWSTNTSGMSPGVGGNGFATSPSIDLSNAAKYVIHVAGQSGKSNGNRWVFTATGTSTGFDVIQNYQGGGGGTAIDSFYFTWQVIQIAA